MSESSISHVPKVQGQTKKRKNSEKKSLVVNLEGSGDHSARKLTSDGQEISRAQRLRRDRIIHLTEDAGLKEEGSSKMRDVSTQKPPASMSLTLSRGGEWEKTQTGGEAPMELDGSHIVYKGGGKYKKRSLWNR